MKGELTKKLSFYFREVVIFDGTKKQTDLVSYNLYCHFPEKIGRTT